MHEMSVTQSVLEIALAHAQKAGANRVLRIYLVIGELSGIVGDSVQFYFDYVGKETLAEGAELVIRHTPAQFRCKACEAVYEPEEADWSCPICGELQPDVVGGREFLVESIEVE